MVDEQKEMTEEEMKKAHEERVAAWEKFTKELEENKNEPVTKGELLEVIQHLSEDMRGIGQMVGMNLHNIQALNHNFNQLVQMLQGAPQGPNKTPGGIILP